MLNFGSFWLKYKKFNFLNSDAILQNEILDFTSKIIQN